jgi:predicted nucleic acid-binding protein
MPHLSDQAATSVARRKMLLSEETRALQSTIRALLLVRPITLGVHETGLALAQRSGLSTCDAIIAASALLADAEILWSEDMPQGMLLGDRLRTVNPFRAIDRAPASPSRSPALMTQRRLIRCAVGPIRLAG